VRERISTTIIGRRTVLAGAAAAIAAPARAQPARPFRVGYPTIGATPEAPQYVAFVERMRELGWTDERRMVIDTVFLAGDVSRYPQAMKDFVARGADVLVTGGPEVSLRAAIAASDSVPIVMSAFDFDPIARGYIKGLARPEGRITGIYIQQIELAEKRAELATALVPGLKAANMVWDEPSADQARATLALAPRLGFEVATHEFTARPYDYAAALDRLPPDRLLLVPNSPTFYFDREKLARLALERKIPAIFAWRDWVLAGGLMSYGPRLTDMNRRVAEYVDRLARGAKVADLPIEQPARIELAINLRTARAIGIEVPPTLLARADEVIE
jgi:putative ABC transport system substrate-binding protein